MRVVTYNVRGLRNGTQVAQVLRGLAADVVGLQEPGRGVVGRVRLAALCRRTGLRLVCRAPSTALLVAPGAVAISPRRLALPRGRRTDRRPLPMRRGAAVADVGSVRVVVLHLGLDAAERAHHLRLLGPVWSGSAPVVVLADLNETPGRPSWRTLAGPLSDAGADAGPTFPAHEPALRIDAVLVDPRLRPDRAWVPAGPPAARASDHRPVVVDLP